MTIRFTANSKGYAAGSVVSTLSAAVEAQFIAAGVAVTHHDAMLAGEPSGVALYTGTGAPTGTAGKGSLYLRKDGSSTSTRMYVNTDGASAWTAVTTAT